MITKLGKSEPLHHGVDLRSSTTTPVEGLDCNLLREVAKDLRFEDLLSMSKVSRQFRNAVSSCCMHFDTLPLPPCLMLTSDPERETRSFRSLYNDTSFELALPEARGRRLWGSQHGWMASVDSELKVKLLHPFSQEQVNLPTLSNLNQRQLPKALWSLMVEKLFVFNIKMDTAKYLVMVILEQKDQLGFTRLEDKEWVLVSNPNKLNFRDVTYVRHKRQVYALCDNCFVMIAFNQTTGKMVAASHHSQKEKPENLDVLIDLPGPLSATVKLIDFYPVGYDAGPQITDRTVRVYLVESADTRHDHLFIVFRFCVDNESDGFDTKTVAFEVYKWNLRDKWIAVDDIGDHAFFVGRNNSWSISPANEVKFNNNSIYFTDDNLEAEGKGLDIGVYDMRRQIEFFYSRASDSSFPQSSWVAPILTPELAINSLN